MTGEPCEYFCWWQKSVLYWRFDVFKVKRNGNSTIPFGAPVLWLHYKTINPEVSHSVVCLWGSLWSRWLSMPQPEPSQVSESINQAELCLIKWRNQMTWKHTVLSVFSKWQWPTEAGSWRHLQLPPCVIAQATGGPISCFCACSDGPTHFTPRPPWCGMSE